MKGTPKDIAVQKIVEMEEKDVLKVLIFMAGMEAGDQIRKKQRVIQRR